VPLATRTRRLTALGNQVLHSTHSPAFLNVARLEELILVERGAGGVTQTLFFTSVPLVDEH